MNFKNRRLITAGVDNRVSPLLQLFLWHCIDSMPPPKDYLQMFNCTIFDGKQKITHIQEVPEYKREYLLDVDTSFFIGYAFAKQTAKRFRDSMSRNFLPERFLLLIQHFYDAKVSYAARPSWRCQTIHTQRCY